MKTPRFIGNFNLAQAQIALADTKVVHQIGRVLRLSPGDEVVLADGQGNEARCRIVELDHERADLTCLERWQNANEPKVRAILYCAVLKKENFDLVVQKATEVGTALIVPLITRRTVKTEVKRERLTTIIHEAAEQSGRGRVPALHEPLDFKAALEHALENEKNVFFDVPAQPAASPDFHVLQAAHSSVGLFIGPEGGWDEAERSLALEAGVETASLGALTLRAETAAIIATYLVTHNLAK